MPVTGPRYTSYELLSLYSPAGPGHTVQQRLRELGLCTVCRLTVSHRRGTPTVCLRRYRGCRAGRQRRNAPVLRSTGNGAFVVSTSRPKRRSVSCSRPRTLVDVCRSAPVGRLAFGLINICSLANKVDDLLEVRRDRGVTSCASLKRGTIQILSVSVACVLTATRSSTVRAHACRPGHRRC